jgi:hypothetical protein
MVSPNLLPSAANIRFAVSLLQHIATENAIREAHIVIFVTNVGYRSFSDHSRVLLIYHVNKIYRIGCRVFNEKTLHNPSYSIH